MNSNHTFQAAMMAHAVLSEGVDPFSLVHVMFYPSSCAWYEEEIKGLSSPLRPGTDLSGHAETYYTLAQLASLAD